MQGNNNTWYGLSKSGEQKQISHEKMMDWALRSGYQYQTGWSNHFCDCDGTRMVRGDNPISEARKAGWNDLADMLNAAGFIDKEQP